MACTIFSRLPKGTGVTPYTYLDFVVPEDRHIAERLVWTISQNFEAL